MSNGLDFLENPPEPRPLSKEESDEPDGGVLFQPGGADISGELNPRQEAAYLLALRRVSKAPPAIERLGREAPEAERPACRKAAEILAKDRKQAAARAGLAAPEPAGGGGKPRFPVPPRRISRANCKLPEFSAFLPPRFGPSMGIDGLPVRGYATRHRRGATR